MLLVFLIHSPYTVDCSKSSMKETKGQSVSIGLIDVQGYQDWARAGPHVDLDGVGQVQSVPSNSINNSCLVNVTQ